MEEYNFTLTNDAAQIEPLQKDLEFTLKASGVRLHFIYALNVALGEWLENIIRHAYPGGGAHQIQVRCLVSEEDILLRVTDDGREFDPIRLPDPDASPAGADVSAARGLHLIRHLMDAVRHERVNGQNVLVMTKLLRN